MKQLEQTKGGFFVGVTELVCQHNYGAAHADWTLNANQNTAKVLVVTNANAAANIVGLPTLGKTVLVCNGSGYNITIKATGQTGVTIANGVSTWVRGTGTDFAAAGISAASAATTSAAGIVELATSAEAVTGTDTERAVTPAALAAVTGGRVSKTLSGTTDVVLTAAEARNTLVDLGGTSGGATNVTVPDGTVKLYVVRNATGSNVTFKTVSGTGITIATAKYALVLADATNVIRITADT